MKGVSSITTVIAKLKEHYPDSRCSLDYKTPFQLLVATMLSAQCTDERVNKTTPGLFRVYPNARAMALATPGEVASLIRSINFFNNKAKALVEMSRALVEREDGEVPCDLDRLVQLRGVGRKTANVVLGTVFKVPSLVVDTHVGRLTRRLGWTQAETPEAIEQDLMKKVPKEDWVILSHLLIDHGRAVCLARQPKCEQCFLRATCPEGLRRG